MPETAGRYADSRRFDGFVMLAGMRTGSNLLEANLNAIPGIVSHGEVFNPHFVGKPNRSALFGIDIAAREADPLALLDALRANTDGLAGFRFFHDHDRRVLARVLPDPRWAKIVLTRNPAETYVSLKIALATDQWRLTNPKRLREARVAFDPAEFAEHLHVDQAFRRDIDQALRSAGQAAFRIDYRDLRDLRALNGLATFLGVEGRLTVLDDALIKQNPGALPDKVTNPEAMAAALGAVDWAGQSDLPDFEPQRPAMVPAYVAAAGAPLLFMPVPGGPDRVVTDWLGRLGTGGTIGGFDRRALRQWKREAGPHRAFTVLRHPLARAHAAFCATLLDDGMPGLRQTLIRVYGLPLGEPGTPMELAEHRTAFLGFLRFLKRNLGGQTGVRTPGAWASQSAVLHGFGQAQPPDHVLREDRMAEGLGFLAAEAGVPMQPLVPVPADAPWPLASVADDDCARAAREAYARDYAAFGFGDRPA